MSRKLDLTGQQYGRLTVLGQERVGIRTICHCRCECGVEKKVSQSNLKSKLVFSCGCLTKELRDEKRATGELIITPNNSRLTWLAFSQVRGDKNRRYSLFQCGCGNTVEVNDSKAKSGYTRSCGCLKTDTARRIKVAKQSTTHGLGGKNTRPPEYKVWEGMKRRCLNKNAANFYNYGGRGITVCERWLDFISFYTDMGSRPSNKHELNRIDNNKGYSPDNCNWVTRKENANNTRHNVLIVFAGKTQTMAQWCDELQLSHSSVCYFYNKGNIPSEVFRLAKTL